MTDDMMNLSALVEKTPDADLLREMIGFAAHRLMELEVEGLTGAAYGEKSQESAWPSATAIAIGAGRPGLARSSCAHSQAAQRLLLPRLSRTAADGRERAHRGSPGGLRPERLDLFGRHLVQAMGMSGISKSQVSRLCGESGRQGTFLNRPIEGDWPPICGSMPPM
jgi:hypothetical protein